MPWRGAQLLTLTGALAAGCGGDASTATTPSPTAGTIYLQATTQLVQTYALDLDTGTFPPGLQTGADLWFQAVTDQQRYLTPMSSATIAVYGRTAPGFSACARAKLSAASIPIDSVTAGLYLCMSTSEGRIAEIRVVEPAGPSSFSAAFTIGYTTFNK